MKIEIEIEKEKYPVKYLLLLSVSDEYKNRVVGGLLYE